MPHPGMELMRTLSEAYLDACKPLCRQTGLPQPALNLLLFFSDRHEGSTAGDFCRAHTVKPNLVSFHVEKLVQEGYLERRPIPEDRRKVRLVCTEKAAPIVSTLKQTLEGFYQALFRGFSQEERALLQSFLVRMNENTRQQAAAERKDASC